MIPEDRHQVANGLRERACAKRFLSSLRPVGLTESLEEAADNGGSMVVGWDGVEELVVGESDGGEEFVPAAPGSVSVLVAAFCFSEEDSGDLGATEEIQDEISLGSCLMRKW